LSNFLVDKYHRGNYFRAKKFVDQRFLVDNYSRGDVFGKIKNFRPKIYWSKFLVDISPRGNDFATIKIFD